MKLWKWIKQKDKNLTQKMLKPFQKIKVITKKSKQKLKWNKPITKKIVEEDRDLNISFTAKIVALGLTSIIVLIISNTIFNSIAEEVPELAEFIQLAKGLIWLMVIVGIIAFVGQEKRWFKWIKI